MKQFDDNSSINSEETTNSVESVELVFYPTKRLVLPEKEKYRVSQQTMIVKKKLYIDS